jgi:hypothetical protein
MDPEDFSDGSDESDLDYIPPGIIISKLWYINYSPKSISFKLPVALHIISNYTRKIINIKHDKKYLCRKQCKLYWFFFIMIM